MSSSGIVGTALRGLGFCNEKEIRHKEKKRADFLPVSYACSPDFLANKPSTRDISPQVGTRVLWTRLSTKLQYSQKKTSMLDFQKGQFLKDPKITAKFSSAVEPAI